MSRVLSWAYVGLLIAGNMLPILGVLLWEWSGFLVLFGQSSGPVAPVDPQRLKEAGSVYLTRPGLDDYIRTRAELVARAEAVFGWVADGELAVRVERHRLGDAVTAYQRLEGRQTTGKVVLIP
jgi:NADPH:quinone reductase